MSLWMAMRFLSRQTICMTGSEPISFNISDAEKLLILTTLVLISVTSTASTYPSKRRLFSVLLPDRRRVEDRILRAGEVAALANSFEIACCSYLRSSLILFHRPRLSLWTSSSWAVSPLYYQHVHIFHFLYDQLPDTGHIFIDFT